MSTPNVEGRLQHHLDAVIDQVERSSKGVAEYHWFRLAVVAVRCLIMIASALWDKE